MQAEKEIEMAANKKSAADKREIKNDMNATELKKEIQEVIDEVRVRGLGNFSKKELQIILLRIDDLMDKAKERRSNYEAAVRWRMPVSQIARLRYEMDLLRLPEDQNEMNALFQEAFRTLSRVPGEPDEITAKTRVRIVIENRLLREFLLAKSKECELVADFSFNREILTLSIDGMIRLCEAILPKNGGKLRDSLEKMRKEKNWEKFAEIMGKIVAALSIV